jgi:hypothetical protein
MLEVPSRRGFLAGLGAILAAPAIVRVASLMPVKALAPDFMTLDEYAERVLAPTVNNRLLTIDLITREAVRLFKNSNAFLQSLENEPNAFDLPFRPGATLRVRLPSGYRGQQ